MKKVLLYPPTHVLLCVILGIYIQHFEKIWKFGFSSLLILNCVFLLLLFFFTILQRKKLFTLLCFLSFCTFGTSATYISNSKNYSNHYTNLPYTSSSALLKISKRLKSNSYYDTYIAKVIQIKEVSSTGSILLNVKKSNKERLIENQLILLKPIYNELKPPLNPYQFDYKNYLLRQGVTHQITTENKYFKIIPNTTSSIENYIYSFRNHLQNELKKYFSDTETVSVMFALLLGQRQDISKALLESYTNAGAVHIIAISGLHIGILYLLLSFVLQPIELLPKGKTFKILILVALLWLFAMFTGLSASVVRAVTMFTFIAIGKVLKNKPPIEFSLISSMLVLLLIKPMFLFNVGFQLSYLAVFGIVWIQPLIARTYHPKLWILNQFWQLTSVSIAAQISTLPVSLYYFHQFPGLFLLSNLIIIPFLGVILGFGFLVIILLTIKTVPDFLIYTYSTVIESMNKCITWISGQEQYIFSKIPMSLLDMLLCYVLIFFIVQILLKRKTNYIFAVLLTIICIQISHIYQNNKNQSTKELIVFHNYKSSIIGIRNGNEMQIVSNLDRSAIEKKKIIASYEVNEEVSLKYDTLRRNIFAFHNEYILVIDSTGVYPKKFKKDPILVLQQSPKINLERVIEELKPKQIIVDGSNYKSYAKRWQLTCITKKTPLHYTNEDGAYILK
ncbi:ComEC/Rec2 family competence protein [Tenacibaculum agarivorans]|uniref:ComEC/Rec2 family competence protein n=1 Tax=Tenacibaculum agarivorans TaxID=1908389 RepID=UPI0009FA51EC|nr:ComEC/Rec2 family competence protein [Tenacibaculum agarivorans]